MIKAQKMLMRLSLFVVLVVVLSGCGANRVKKIGLSFQNFSIHDELLMIDTKEDIELIMDVIKSAKEDEDLPLRQEIFYYFTIYYSNNKQENLYVAIDPDRDLFFISSMDYRKKRIYTITQEQFEIFNEIFNR